MTTTIITPFSIIRENDQLKIIFNGGNDEQSWHITNISFVLDPSFNFIFLGNNLATVKILYTESTTPIASNINEYLRKLLALVDNENNLDVSAGIVSNKTAIIIDGFNPSISTMAEDVWVIGGNYNFLTGATILDIISLNTEDDASGLGAQNVFIDGLDSTFVGITEIISLVGTTSTQTSNMFSRINFMNVVDSGTYHGANFDDITAQTSDGKILGRIDGVYTESRKGTVDYGSGRTSLGVFTVPKDKTAFITSINVCNDSNRKGNYALYKYENTDNSIPPTKSREIIWRCSGVSNGLSEQFQQFIRVPEKSDIWMRCRTNGGNSTFSMSLTVVLVNNIIP